MNIPRESNNLGQILYLKLVQYNGCTIICNLRDWGAHGRRHPYGELARNGKTTQT